MSETEASESPTQLIDIGMAIEGLADAVRAATEGAPEAVVERYYRIAGHLVLVRVVGPRMAADIEKALWHARVTADTDPELTIEIWDDGEVGPLNWAPWPEDAETNGTITLAEEDRYVLTQRPSSVLLLDRLQGRIVGYLRGQDSLYQDERARPFHRLLSIWLDDRDIQFIHAGLVEQGGKGLLLVGKGGSGKTTSAIACLLGGFTFLSDDYVALEATAEGKIVGHSLYATCLIDRVERFPTLARIAQAPNHDFAIKDLIFLADQQAHTFAAKTHISAIVMPKVVDRPDTVYRRAKRMEAMLALAPSSLWILPGSASFSLNKMDELVTTVPAFWLELGRDHRIAPTVMRLVSELAD